MFDTNVSYFRNSTFHARKYVPLTEKEKGTITIASCLQPQNDRKFDSNEADLQEVTIAIVRYVRSEELIKSEECLLSFILEYFIPPIHVSYLKTQRLK
jgi:hypothetical protein